MSENRDALAMAVLVVLICLGIVLYFVPLIVAVVREHPNAASIAVVNICLGWTLVGYVVALAWSFLAIDREQFPTYRQRLFRHRNVPARPAEPGDDANPFDFS